MTMMGMGKKKGRPKLKGDALSRQRIGQIQQNALRKLRKRLRAMGITKVDDLI